MIFEVLNIRSLTEAELEKCFQAMSINRRERCLRYKNPLDRQRMIAAELLLKRVIAGSFGESTDCIRVENLPSGKPVANIKGRELCVSISHSGDFVAAAVSEKEVGIDIETFRSVSPQLLKRAFNSDEEAFAMQGETDELTKEQTERFLRVWTAKEAFVKLTGEGLAGLKGAQVMPLILNKEAQGKRLLAECTEEYICTVIEAL